MLWTGCARGADPTRGAERTERRAGRVLELAGDRQEELAKQEDPATCDATGQELTIAVVNRDRDRSRATTIDLAGAAATGELHVFEVNGPDVGATNSFEHPERVSVREHRRPATGHRLE